MSLSGLSFWSLALGTLFIGAFIKTVTLLPDGVSAFLGLIFTVIIISCYVAHAIGKHPKNH